ncbi:glycosyl hydrolase family 18 protein [Alkalihalobacillus trypoxylicola]|uniref:glycosyl hydrolase family 18 protein n=1 Tax=Alkalihalobacillus trypoxylicola TaxID=519424 RepID=UPI000ADBF734|nr:glycosyl hydrolase family 18 protein [Alkalihalobacillus trypoxylicola]
MSARHFLLIGLCSLILASCQANDHSSMNDKKELQEALHLTTSLWVVDWQSEESLQDAETISHSLHNLILFGTYFDENGDFYQPDSAEEMVETVLTEKEHQSSVYLSFVNDQFMDDGTIIQKNPDLLVNILETDYSRKEHIEQILSFVHDKPIDGIEMDYEKIPTEYKTDFFLFTEELGQALQPLNLSLRVVLEPGFLPEENELQESIDYVVMAYNLYGFHSEPGPKASYEFLEVLSKRFPNDLGNIGMALATGGFSWQGDHVQALSEQDALALISKHELTPTRDPNSGAMTFTFIENHQLVEVWYADGITLKSWVEYLMELDDYRDFSFWRAGQLAESTLNHLANLNEDVMKEKRK